MDYNQFKAFMSQYIKELEAKPVSGWAGEAWDWAREQGLLDGTSPRGPLTREQAAAVLSRVLKEGKGF